MSVHDVKRFRDIPPYLRADYACDVGWEYIEDWIASNDEYFGVELQPDFQRAHVWTDAQRTKYVEWILRGGWSGKDIFWNCAGWNSAKAGVPIQLVDGLQRVTTARMFMHGELKAFGRYVHEFEDKWPCMHYQFRFHVASLKTRTEVLQWYLDLNDGGVVHTTEELDRVRGLLEAERRL